MGWIEITSALFLVAMMVFLFPRMKAAVAQSRKAEPGEWMGVVVPLIFVVGFVLLLMASM
jgi:hypothetical protein